MLSLQGMFLFFNPWFPIWWNKMMIFVCFLTVPNEWEVVKMQGTNEKIKDFFFSGRVKLNSSRR